MMFGAVSYADRPFASGLSDATVVTDTVVRAGTPFLVLQTIPTFEMNADSDPADFWVSNTLPTFEVKR